MNADGHFVIGQAHAVCEDYAIARRLGEGRAIAVVSDGCSSSPGSDVGARILALTTARAPAFDIRRVLRRADAIRRALELPAQALDATLLGIEADRDRAVVHAWGDGFILARRRDGTLELHRIEYPSHAPAYPSYLLDADRCQAYLAQGLGERLVTADAIATSRDGDAMDPVRRSFDAADYELVAVASDGVATLSDRDGRAVPAREVAELLARFRSPCGAFVRRRLRRFASECAALGWTASDDIAVAAVVWEDVR